MSFLNHNSRMQMKRFKFIYLIYLAQPNSNFQMPNQCCELFSVSIFNILRTNYNFF